MQHGSVSHTVMEEVIDTHDFDPHMQSFGQEGVPNGNNDLVDMREILGAANHHQNAQIITHTNNNNANSTSSQPLIFTMSISNARELADCFFDCFLEIDLDSEDVITRETLWGILLQFVGEENILKIQAWVGKTIKTKIIEQKIRMILQTDELPKIIDSNTKKAAEKWYTDQEKRKQQTLNSKRLVHFVKFKQQDITTIEANPYVRQLAKLLNKEIHEFLLTEQQKEQYTNHYKKWMCSLKAKMEEHRNKTTTSIPITSGTKRKYKKMKQLGGKESDVEDAIELDEEIESYQQPSFQEQQFPYIQLVETPECFKVFVHIPFVDGPLKVIARSQCIILVGKCKMPAVKKDEKVLYSNFHDGEFAREINFPALVDKTSIKRFGQRDSFEIVINKLADEPVVLE